MRRLLPPPDPADDRPGDVHLTDEELAAAYASPPGPWVRANMVATADGAAQSLQGRSGGISGEADKRLFGLLRALADGVLVGASTVRREGYGPARRRGQWAERRVAEGRAPVPTIAVVSGHLDLDPDAAVFTEAAQRTVVLTVSSAPADRRSALARVADVVDAGESTVDLGLAVKALHQRGLTSLLCEGGPRLLAQVAGAGVLDELCLTVSPLLTAGDATRVLNGLPLVPPLSMRLGHVLEEDGYLFCRYLREDSHAG